MLKNKKGRLFYIPWVFVQTCPESRYFSFRNSWCLLTCLICLKVNFGKCRQLLSASMRKGFQLMVGLRKCQVPKPELCPPLIGLTVWQPLLERYTDFTWTKIPSQFAGFSDKTSKKVKARRTKFDKMLWKWQVGKSSMQGHWGYSHKLSILLPLVEGPPNTWANPALNLCLSQDSNMEASFSGKTRRNFEGRQKHLIMTSFALPFCIHNVLNTVWMQGQTTATFWTPWQDLQHAPSFEDAPIAQLVQGLPL